MTEKPKEELYLAYLDQILAGETDIGPVEEVEIAELLVLAMCIIAADFSVDRERLKAQILAQVKQNNQLSLSSLPGNDELLDDELNEELNEEFLEYVAAAGQFGEGNYICPYCGSELNQFQRKCPICSH